MGEEHKEDKTKKHKYKGRKAKDLVSLFSSIDIALRNRVIE